MSKTVLIVSLLSALMFVGVSTANACPKKKKCDCVCQCDAECKLGKKCKIYKSCKWVDECETKTVCKWKKVCDQKKKCCGDDDDYEWGDDDGDDDGCKKCTWKKVCEPKKCCKKVKKCTQKKCCKCKTEEDCKNCPPCICPKPEPDGGPVEPDSGPCPTCPDSGPCPTCPDSGPTEPDSGPTEPDAGPVVPDSGPCPTCPDSGPAVPDAGPTQPDMEVVEVDGGCVNCPDGTTEETEDDLEMMGGGCSVSNTGSGMGTALCLLFVTLLFGFVRKSRATMLAVAAMLFIAAPAYAYDNDYHVTEGGKVLDHLQPELGIKFDYARRAAQILRKSDGNRITDTIAHNHVLSLYSHIGFWNRLEIGITLPFELSQKTTGLRYLGESHNTELDGGLGNIILSPKARLLTVGDKTKFHLGLIAPIELPTTTYDSLVGYNAPAISPQLALELDTRYVDAALNFGYSFRTDNSLIFRNQSVSMDDALVGSLGVKVAVWEHKMEIVGDSWFSMGIDEQDEEEVPVEILGGLRFYLPRGFQADVGAGAGLTKGIGAPTFRIMAGISWSPEAPARVRTIYKEKDCPECPPVVKPKPVIVEKTLIIPPVYFDTDKHNLRPDAIATLNDTIALLKRNTWVTKVRLEGHCDHRMPHKYNEKLSKRRVTAVRDYLVKNGVKLERLEARAYGETQRVDTTKTEEGMQKNRRVEFHILETNR